MSFATTTPCSPRRPRTRPRWAGGGRREKLIGKSPFVEIVIEPRAGGRWFERDAEGIDTNWGKVIAWEPPTRLLLGWQLDSRFAYNPDLLTEVELTFAPAAAGGAVVTLEHRNLERFGDDAEKIAAQLGGGWLQDHGRLRWLRRGRRASFGERGRASRLSRSGPPTARSGLLCRL